MLNLATLATDPDGDQLTYRWWHHRESSSYPAEIAIHHETEARTTIQVPKHCSAGQSIHMICAVTDEGTPPLTRYRRIIVTCRND
jgi:hypothetical protein